jgi:DNA repair protein RadC
MSIKDWPKGERPRERLLCHGAEVLSDSELLAILLSTGSSAKGLTALDCARLMLETHANLRNLSGLSCAELCRLPGVGPGKASRIRAACELAKRLLAQKRMPGTRMRRSQDVFEAYSVKLRDEKQESFTVLMLDSRNQMLRDDTIAVGCLNHSIVHPREAFVPAIREMAAAVIFIHNHPSGNPEPSEEDVALTERLVRAGRLLGIRVLDHIILGEGTYYSFCDKGHLMNLDCE